MNKKAQTNKYLLALILFVVVLFILMFWQKGYSKTAQDTVDDTLCKQAVKDHVVINYQDWLTEPEPIKCPTEYITIPKEEKNEETQKRLANMMYRTWDDFLRGEAPLFNKRGIYCHIRYYFDFEDTSSEVKGLPKYLAETRIPTKDFTYMNFLTNTELDEHNFVNYIKDPKALEEETLEGDKKYAVIFVYARGASYIKKATKDWGALKSGIGAGVAAGIGAGTIAIMIVSNPVGWAIGAAVGIFTLVKTIVGKADSEHWVAYTLLREYDKTTFEELKCKEWAVEQS